MTVWAYGRVSTVEQAAEDRSSLEDQLRRCRGVAMAAGLPDPVEVVDPGVSGSIPLADRPEGGKMCAEMKAGDIVIAAKLDRLFRSASDALNSVERMKADGIKLILADIGSDPVTESAVAKMFLTILAGVAEFEKYRILERMRDGREGKKRDGGHIGGQPPYGFRKIGTGKAARLEPDETELETICFAQQWRGEGLALRSICKRLEGMGRVSRTGTPFSPIQIARMCERESVAPAL